MQKARGRAFLRRGIALPHVVDSGFQVLFTPLEGVLFTFPSRYWFTIGRRLVFSLGRWSSRIPTGFHVSRGTWETDPGSRNTFAYRAITFYGGAFQPASASETVCNFPRPLQEPPICPHDTDDATAATFHATPVWAVPRSLAATWGIAVAFCSFGY